MSWGRNEYNIEILSAIVTKNKEKKFQSRVTFVAVLRCSPHGWACPTQLMSRKTCNTAQCIRLYDCHASTEGLDKATGLSLR